MLSDSKFPLWRADLKNSGFACEFAEYVWTIAVSGKKKLRIKKYPDTCGRGLGTTLPSIYTEVMKSQDHTGTR